jgi:4-amino-4-deoxy-L-arabinose transferase-like glycosyltransferase
MQQRQLSPGASIEAHSGWMYATIAVVTGMTILHLSAAIRVGLVPDETYYWLWSRAPSFGYYDHPPMVAWMISLGTQLFGNTAFGIRVLFVAAIPLTSAALYLTGRLLFDNEAIAILGTIWFNASLLAGVGGIFATPDAPSVLFWSLALLALALVWRTEAGVWWLAVGAAAGLGAISKYTNLFFGLGVLAWLLADRRARHWLLNRWLWAGGLVALLIFLPNLVWNAEHHWVSFAKQFGRIAPHRLQLRFIPDFLLVQAGLLNPLVAVFAAMAAAASVKRRTASDAPVMFLFAVSAPLILYMLLHSFHDRVQGNWLAPIYPSLALLAAAIAVPLGERAETARWLKRAKVAAAPLGLSLSVLCLLYLAAPSGLFGAKDPSQLTRGWSPFADRLVALAHASHADWIGTASYALTGELAYHLRSQIPVREIVDRERYTFEPPLQYGTVGERALIVVRAARAHSDAIKACFEQVLPLGSLDRTTAKRSPGKYVLYLAVRPTVALDNGNCVRPETQKVSDRPGQASKLLPAVQIVGDR